MITTILEVLVAVVVLIVIIAVAALHFLRADDSDTFDDIPEEPRRTRRHPADPAVEPALVPAGRGRSRQPEPATEQWAAAGRGGRPGDDRGPVAYRGQDGRAASRDRRDRDSRDRDSRDRDSRDRDASSRPAKPERSGGRANSGQRPAPVPAMQGTTRPGKPARPADADSAASDWDKLSDVDYWAELASDKPLTPAVAASSDSSRPPRRRADQNGDARSAPRAETTQLPLRQRSQSRSAPAPRSADPGQTEQIDVRAARPGSRHGSEPATQSLAALARLADQPAASSQPPGLPSGQRSQRPANGRPLNGRPSGGGQRPAPATDRRALPAGPLPGTGQRPAQPALPQAPAAQISHSGGHARPPQPLDDDPLTSPSFPAINTSDSRSYRTRRPSSSQGSQPPALPRPSGHGTGGYSEPPQPYTPYPPAPDRSSSVPNGYPVQPAASPVANPYGSYVNAPGHSGSGTSATPQLDAAAYGSGYAAGQQAIAGLNWYASTQDASQAAVGYLPAAGNGNGVSYESPTYQGSHAAQAGGNGPGYVAGHHDQRGYLAPELTYGQDGYQGYPGYGGSGR
jgi:hypothetical protein